MDYDYRQPYIPSYLRQDYAGPPQSTTSTTTRARIEPSRARSQSRHRRRYSDEYSDVEDRQVERRRRQSIAPRGRKSYVYDDSESEDERYGRSKSRGRAASGAGGGGGRGGGKEKSTERMRDEDVPSESYTMLKAAKSSLVAAAVEAVRCRHEPGPWTGQKGKRVATAAMTGAAYGALRNGRLRKEGKLPIADAAVTGIYAVDFFKRVLRQTDHEKGAEEARKQRGAYDRDYDRGYDRDYDEREYSRRR